MFKKHASALEKIAATKGEAFYRGELAEKLEAEAKKQGGAMRASDLAAHKSDWVKPLRWTIAATRCTRSRLTARASSR